MPAGAAKLDGLTALRFFAALWVVVFHFRNQPALDIDDSTRLLEKGYVAVDFFFILSGYIMAHVYGEAVRSGRFSHRDYIWRRFARLYPLHLVTLAGVLVLYVGLRTVGDTSPSDERFNFALLPMHLLMVHAWGTTPYEAWNRPSWSISAEFAAYLLFPALMWLALRGRPGRALVGAVVFLALAWGLVQAVGGYEMTRLQSFGVIRIIPEFFLGLTLRRLDPRIPGRVLAVAGVLVLALVQWSPSDLLIVLALAVIVAGLAHAGAAAWLVYLGEASFALYMVHSLVETAYFYGLRAAGLEPTGPLLSVVALVIGVTLAIVVAIAAHELIEKPARRWLTHRSTKAAPDPSQAPPPVRRGLLKRGRGDGPDHPGLPSEGAPSP